MLVLFRRACREFYKIKVKDDIRALPSPESPGFKPRYKRVSRVRIGVDCLYCRDRKDPIGVEETRSGE